MKGRLIVVAASLWLATAACHRRCRPGERPWRTGSSAWSTSCQELKERAEERAAGGTSSHLPRRPRRCRRGSAPAAEPAGEKEPVYRSALDRVKLGGYGSFRFEHNGLDDTTTPSPAARRPDRGREHRAAPALRHRARVRTLPPARGGEDAQRHRRRAARRAGDRGDQQVGDLAGAGLAAVRPLGLAAPARRRRAGAGRPLQPQPRRQPLEPAAPLRWSTAARRFCRRRRRGTSSVSASTATSSSATTRCWQLSALRHERRQPRHGDRAVDREPRRRHDAQRHRGQGRRRPPGTFGIDVQGRQGGGRPLRAEPAARHEIAASFYWGRYTPDFLPDREPVHDRRPTAVHATARSSSRPSTPTRTSTASRASPAASPSAPSTRKRRWRTTASRTRSSSSSPASPSTSRLLARAALLVLAAAAQPHRPRPARSKTRS